MKKYLILAVIVVSSLAVAGCSINQNGAKNKGEDQIPKTVSQAESPTENSNDESAQVVEAPITPPVTQSKNIAYKGQEGQTALKLLEATHKVEKEETSFGVLVKAIDGVTNSPDHYWMFYVNDAQASVGADSYITKEGEKIEWRYEELKY